MFLNAPANGLLQGRIQNLPFAQPYKQHHARVRSVGALVALFHHERLENLGICST